MLRVFSIFCLFALLCTSVRAANLDSPNRLVRSFDFEEREAGNSEDLPAEWVKVEGSGFPHYVNGHLASDQANSGRYSFRFDLHGGNLVYRYPAGNIKVFPLANYRISTMVKAGAMENARAQLTAYFTDIDGKPIKSTIKRSAPYPGGEGWQKLEIELEANDDARSAVVELGLVQPSVWKETTLGNRALFEQDIDVTAWFDDVLISQVPKVRLSTPAPANVFRHSDPLVIKVKLNDRLTSDLVGKLVVFDAAGKQVFQRSGSLDLTAAEDPDSKSSDRFATLSLPDLPPGWYRASLAMSSQGVSIGDNSIDLVRLADDATQVEPDERFGVVATDLPIDGWPDLPVLLPYLGAARVKVTVWGPNARVDQTTQSSFATLLESLRRLNVLPTACLVSPPPDIAETIGGATWAHMLKASPDRWQPQLSYLVSRYSGLLDRWQFGLDEQANDFVTDAVYRKTYQAVHEQFEKLVARPDIAMPWPAMVEMPADMKATLALTVPSDVTPEQLPLYSADFQKQSPGPLSVSLQPLPTDRYGRDARLRDMIKRITYTLASGVNRIDLPLPFRTTGTGEQIERQPDELLMIIRTAIMHLGGATYKGKLPIGDGVEAFLFDRAGEGVVIMWVKDDVESKPRTAQVVLGKQPRRVDMWGNISPVLQPRDQSGVIEFDVGANPTMLVGIDGQLARLRSSFVFDNPMIESTFKTHTRHLRFTNPYNSNITGRIYLTGPANWSVTPQNPNFTLNPGETFDCAVNIDFPYSSFEGNKPIRVDVEMQAGDIQRFSVPLSLKLGLGEIGMSTIALRDGDDVIVQQVITNYSDKPVNYNAFAAFPGSPRQERLLTGLKAGSTVIKKYRFKNADFKNPAGSNVRTGVKETEGTRVLNDETPVK